MYLECAVAYTLHVIIEMVNNEYLADDY